MEQPLRISVAEAKQDKLQYVVANFAIVDVKRSAVLLLQRGPHETVHPGKWAFPGGKLEHKNIAEMIDEEGADPLDGVENVLGKLATRETTEESGVSVSSEGSVMVKNKVFVRPDGIPVFMVTLATRYQGGEVTLEEGFVDYAWVAEDKLSDYDCIPGIVEEAQKAIKSFK